MDSDACNALPRYQGKSEAEIERFGVFYTEAQKVVDSKQLRPAIRTQYMRTAFQIPFDSTVRVSLDTNLVMIKENPSDGPTCHATGRCVPPRRVPSTHADTCGSSILVQLLGIGSYPRLSRSHLKKNSP